MFHESKLDARSSTGRRKAGLGLLIATVLVVASCSTSVSSSDDATTTSGAPASTTTAPNPELTEADLQGLLPTAEQVGADFRVDSDEDDDDDNPFGDALDDACPALAELSDDDDSDADAEREFSSADDRTVTVSLADDVANSQVPDEAALDEVVDAVDDCGTISFTSDGIDFTAGIDMELDDAFGDFGVIYTMDFRAESAQLPAPMVFDAVARMYVMGDVAVVVSALGSVDSTTLETIPADADIVDRLAEQLESDLGELLER
ncbi:MAG TPA: hypothetical protein VFN21_08805 [Acidimicrobiales bacterium]|nr:hypothetical protein [Acidimicrobiales bacterium]